MGYGLEIYMNDRYNEASEKPVILDKGTTMLLMADFSTTGMGQNPIVEERHTLEGAREVLDAARRGGIFVGYCISHFHPGFPEVSGRSTTRAARRDAGEVLPVDPAALILPEVQPRAGEPVIAKHRTSAFSGSAFEMILRAHNIETLILMGHATSGVILSTVRLAADLDYRLMVVKDGCADRDPEVHRVLMAKVFPRQGTVVSAQDLEAALAAW
jgi:nicotinamidase-related amidase